MRLFQRYILGELIRVFSLLLVVLTVMLVFVGLIGEANDRGLGATQMLQIHSIRFQWSRDQNSSVFIRRKTTPGRYS